MLWARQYFETRLKLNMVKWRCLYFILQMSKITATASVELNIVLPHLSLFLYGSFNVYQAVAFLTHWVFLKIPKQETYNKCITIFSPWLTMYIFHVLVSAVLTGGGICIYCIVFGGYLMYSGAQMALRTGGTWPPQIHNDPIRPPHFW